MEIFLVEITGVLGFLGFVFGQLEFLSFSCNRELIKIRSVPQLSGKSYFFFYAPSCQHHKLPIHPRIYRCSHGIPQAGKTFGPLDLCRPRLEKT